MWSAFPRSSANSVESQSRRVLINQPGNTSLYFSPQPFARRSPIPCPLFPLAPLLNTSCVMIAYLLWPQRFSRDCWTRVKSGVTRTMKSTSGGRRYMDSWYVSMFFFLSRIQSNISLVFRSNAYARHLAPSLLMKTKICWPHFHVRSSTTLNVCNVDPC